MGILAGEDAVNLPSGTYHFAFEMDDNGENLYLYLVSSLNRVAIIGTFPSGVTFDDIEIQGFNLGYTDGDKTIYPYSFCFTILYNTHV
jgi:hypothetical protein